MSIDRMGGILPNRARIPKKWSDYMLANYYADNVVPNISNHDYAGEISAVGDQVIIQKRTAITSYAYKVGQGLQKQATLADDSITLDISYANYFNVPLSDVDKMQSIGDYAAEIFDEASRTLGQSVEQQILQTIYSSAGSTVTASALDASNALKFLLQASLKLNQANIPQDNRWAVIDPITAYFLNLSDLKAAYLTGDNGTPLRTGYAVDKPVAGFKVYISNNLTASASSAKVLCGHMDALTFAGQINKTETLRDPDDFGDLLRGQIVYGYKVVQPTALCLVDVTSFGSL